MGLKLNCQTRRPQRLFTATAETLTWASTYESKTLNTTNLTSSKLRAKGNHESHLEIYDYG